jgi:alpha-L-rhamnosidase
VGARSRDVASRSAQFACFLGAILAILAILVPVTGASAASPRPAPTPVAPGPPEALKVDRLTAPIGLGLNDIQFGWQVNDRRRGAIQSAYRIVVSRPAVTSAPDAAALVWDSGRIAGSDQFAVPYLGPVLAPDAAYQWTVQTWGPSDGPGPLAAPARFETGLTDQDWQAQWIQRPSSEPDQHAYARKEFALSGSPIVRARVYVSADQQYELSINGVRIGKGQAYSYPDRRGQAGPLADHARWPCGHVRHPSPRCQPDRARARVRGATRRRRNGLGRCARRTAPVWGVPTA